MYERVRFDGYVALGGYAALALTPAALLVAAVLEAPQLSAGTVAFGLGLALVGAVAVAGERARVVDAIDTGAGFDEADLVDGLAVAAGAVVTYWLSVAGGLGPVLASALVGLVVGLALPRVGAPVYCGSFVGMASPAAFPSLEYVALAGVVSGVAYVASSGSFGGVGGKLGTIALFGCASTAALVGLEYGEPAAPQGDLAALVVPVAAVAAVATVVLALRFGLGAVVGSGLVGVVAGLAFPAVGGEVGATLAAVTFCASFVGMSSADRLAGSTRVGLAGALCGVVYLAATPAFTGAGGKLGTIAFVSCLGLIGGLELFDAVRSRLGAPDSSDAMRS